MQPIQTTCARHACVVHVCLRACMCVRVRAYVYACGCVHVCMHVCVHVCMRACVYVCMHACVHVSRASMRVCVSVIQYTVYDTDPLSGATCPQTTPAVLPL